MKINYKEINSMHQKRKFMNNENSTEGGIGGRFHFGDKRGGKVHNSSYILVYNPGMGCWSNDLAGYKGVFNCWTVFLFQL